jgi:hypothetical protein
MSKARAQELIDLGNKLFDEKRPLDELNQEIAENVYPERADFTRERYLGENFADHQMDSFPNLARRELGNSMSSFLRPRARNWFETTTLDDGRDVDPENARFLEHITKVVKAKIYHPKTNFIASTKAADHDFVSFGNCVLSIEDASRKASNDYEGPRDFPYFECHHPRDAAWQENEISCIDHIHLKGVMTARQMKRKFGEKALAQEVKQACEKTPNKKVTIRRIVMPSDEYDYIGGDAKGKKGKRLPFVVVYLDVDNVKILREGGLHDFLFAIPRWHRIGTFPYGFSPPGTTSLPDARMAQMLASIILESGEKQIEPPIVALDEKVREASLMAGSITWVDATYDGPVKDAMAALQVEGDMRIGFEMRKDVRDMLSKAWFLDKLALPEAGREMTAYETARRVEEHVRNLLPLFEPMEIEYNTAVLDKAFSVLDNMGAFSWAEMPDGLSGADITWTFKNPMQEASSRILVSQYQEALGLIQSGFEIAQATGQPITIPVKLDVALKDALRGTSMPATWRKTPAEEEAEAAAAQEAAAEQQEKDDQLQAAQEVAGVVEMEESAGNALQSLQNAGVVPMPKSRMAPAGKPRKAA